MDDLELERMMSQAAPPLRDDAFVLAVLAGMKGSGQGRLAGLVEGAAVVCGLGLAWKGLEALPPAVLAQLSETGPVAGAAAVAVLLALTCTRAVPSA